uniref:Ribonuclease toxin, BrnT, of type II toxin-antitoxin system n=1 Tax=Candidatus Kentrum sp. FW TaxID=2126338 RepID=A0A450TN09_9GAMM|nr:MAG: Ribonuclease toxin, BrnT, of type II toxin-antitoxin system [Candidatus Kentron sp. FW]
MFGMSFTLRVLVVCHCYQEDDSVIRLISARKADKQERSEYWSRTMREHYDFSNMKGQKNPYANRLKQSVTMHLDKPTVAYFESLAEELGMPYESLINLYLRDCALHHKKPDLTWVS